MMDRSFNFFDHPSVIRQSSTGNNSQNSPSLLPQTLFQPQHQHLASNIQDRQHQQQESHQRPHQPHHPSLQHSLHHQYSHNRQVHHQAHQHPSRISQQLSQQRLHNILPPHSHQQTLSQQQSYPQAHDQGVPNHQIHQQLHLHPVDSHAFDPVVAAAEAGVSHNSCSQQLQSHQRSCQQRQLHTHRYQVHQMQVQRQQRQHHSSQQSPSQHHTPSSSNHLSSMNPTRNAAQLSSPVLPTSSNNGNFSAAVALSQNTTHFGQAPSRDPHLHHHPSQFQMHSQGSVSHQPLAPPSNPSTSFVAPLQMQAVLPHQQGSNTASFGSLGNLQNSVLPGNAVDDPPGSASQFGSQSGDTLGGIGQWEPSHQHVALGSQGITASQTQPQHLLPLPVVGDTRTNNSASCTPQNQSFGSQAANVQSNYGGTLNNGMSALGSSLNTNAVVSGLVPITGNAGQTGPGSGRDHLKPTVTSLSPSGDLTTTGKPVKKPKPGVRKTLMGKGSGSRSAQPLRGPITSPVSTATLPNSKKQVAAKMASNSHHHQYRMSKIDRVTNSGGHDCTFVMGEEVSHSAGVTATASLAASAPAAPRTEIVQSMGGLEASEIVTVDQTQVPSAGASDSLAAWPGKKTNAGRSKKSRRNPDGTPTVPVPVHLRNPKKGRARVFRECQRCRSENHIRRSECFTCHASLPAGKRRRDGNPSYTRNASRAPATPDTQAGSNDPTARSGVKEDVSVPSVAGN